MDFDFSRIRSVIPICLGFIWILLFSLFLISIGVNLIESVFIFGFTSAVLSKILLIAYCALLIYLGVVLIRTKSVILGWLLSLWLLWAMIDFFFGSLAEFLFKIL